MRRSVNVLATIALLISSSCGVELPEPKQAPRVAEPENRLPDAVTAALTHADRVEVLSLSPYVPKTPPAGAYHGWKVLGRTTLNDAVVRNKVVSLVVQGVAESDGTVMLCFEPRHAIRARSGEAVVDLVICFACHQIEAYLNGVRSASVSTASASEIALDEVLLAAGVQLAPKG